MPPSIDLGRYHQSDMVEIAAISDQYYHNHLRVGAVHMEVASDSVSAKASADKSNG